MSKRISSANLETVCKMINKVTHSPEHYHSAETKANVGHFLIDSAYGWYALHRVTQGGGEQDVFNTGHVPAKKLYELCHAFLLGLTFMD
jgi:hypothetical protein